MVGTDWTVAMSEQEKLTRAKAVRLFQTLVSALRKSFSSPIIEWDTKEPDALHAIFIENLFAVSVDLEQCVVKLTDIGSYPELVIRHESDFEQVNGWVNGRFSVIQRRYAEMIGAEDVLAEMDGSLNNVENDEDTGDDFPVHTGQYL